jgi:hypothetical protein
MRTCELNRPFLCLDMFPVRWGSGRLESLDSAILLEIGESGGLLQTGVEVPRGEKLTLALPDGTVSAKARSCKKDEFGYLVEISVNSPGHWFPQSYEPRYLKEKITKPNAQSSRKQPAAARTRRKTVALASAWKPAKGGRRHR